MKIRTALSCVALLACAAAPASADPACAEVTAGTTYGSCQGWTGGLCRGETVTVDGVPVGFEVCVSNPGDVS